MIFTVIKAYTILQNLTKHPSNKAHWLFICWKTNPIWQQWRLFINCFFSIYSIVFIYCLWYKSAKKLPFPHSESSFFQEVEPLNLTLYLLIQIKDLFLCGHVFIDSKQSYFQKVVMKLLKNGKLKNTSINIMNNNAWG